VGKVRPSTSGMAVKWRSLVAVRLSMLYVATFDQTREAIPYPRVDVSGSPSFPRHADATALE
jgi:hypothetical protein